MNARIIKSLVLGFAFAVVVFAGSASSGAAQVCDAYGCYYPDPSYGVVPAPGYGGGCDPYTGICYEAVPAPVYGGACDPYLGCVNIVQAPVYQPAYAPICDPFTGVCV